MQGVLLINKPKGWTSFDAVNYVRKRVAQVEGKKPKHVKVGHTGTLDPLATGLLVLLVGKEYTRRAGELSGLDKTYEVTMKLGWSSTTGDEEGEKVRVSEMCPSREAVGKVLDLFTGSLMQVPPAFSAMKINGQRAYKLARAGKVVTLQPRPVMIYENTLTNYEYPFVRFTTRVSSGTYVRSLVEDMGEALKSGAYMADLCRTHVGKYDIKDAVEPQGRGLDAIEDLMNN